MCNLAVKRACLIYYGYRGMMLRMNGEVNNIASSREPDQARPAVCG